ncbi:MAG: YjgN family protein [Hyphomicrobiaceae bacterium]
MQPYEQTPSTPSAVPAGEPLKLTWQWPRGMVGVSIANFFLRILTLGIYHFWGKTEVRRRIWSAIRLNGEPLTYTGTGGELFLGFVIVTIAIFIPITVLMLGVMIAFGPDSAIAQAIPGLLYLPILFLVGVAIYRATRYRLARTRWRGIRGALVGHSGHYGWTFFWTLIVAGVTLGWAVPWRSTKLQALQISNMRFGDRPLRFTATSGPLYGPYAAVWFGTVVLYGVAAALVFAIIGENIRLGQATGQPIPPSPVQMGQIALIVIGALMLLSIISAWYQARVFNHFANHTHFESAQFSGNASAGGLIWIAISNFLIALAGVALLAVPAALLGYSAYRGLGAMAENPEVMQALLQTIPLVLFLVLGLGFSLFSPLTQARRTGYLVRHLAVAGTAPLAAIAQASGADAKYGEGLAQAFDVDAF